MIGKQIKGRGFRGLLNYLESSEGARMIGGNMGGRNARELAQEFKWSRQLNPNASRVVYHASLSLPPTEKLSDEQWQEIAAKYLEEMGFDENQYVVYRHFNQDHDHIHICASRIRLDNGKCVSDSWDYKRSEKVIRAIEQEYGLQPVIGSSEKLTRRSSTGQVRKVMREMSEYQAGIRTTPPSKTVKRKLQDVIQEVASYSTSSMMAFVIELYRQGVKARIGYTRTGKIKGITYYMDNEHFSGTQLGAAFTFPGVQKHLGVNYSPSFDDEKLQRYSQNPEQLAEFINEQTKKQSNFQR
jgi:hypothetical protein